MDKYIIGDDIFETKQEITSFVREILSRHKEGEFLEEKDFLFVYNLLQRHDDPKRKIGCGIKGIRKITSSYGKNAFEIVRIDGTLADFSYVKCINPRNGIYPVRAACRDAIREDIVNFRENYFLKNQDAEGRVVCALNGQKISKQECHVDHEKPHTFDFIFREWLGDRKIDVKSIEIGGYGDGEETKYFKDSKIKEDFREFHKTLANLRIVKIEDHLRLKKK